MKIRTIRLGAYGPFTGVIIDFADTGSDFHMIFGPNEAGKSSALRALRNMLFGIPARTPDNFLHGYANLRVGSKLVKSDGTEIEFIRRKGQAKTLRGPDDESVLDDDALVSFLGGVRQGWFEQMFAIGHEDLVQGGEEIISGKGRIGEALFAAGAGLIRLQTVQQGLAQECGALFKPSGSTPRINQTISSLKAVRKNQKEALLPAKTWQGHDRSLRDAQIRMEKVLELLGRNNQSVAKRQRICEALPLIARKKEIDAKLVALQGVPDLPDDFGEKRRDAEKDLKIATRDFARSRETIGKINGQIEALPVPAALIQHAVAIEALQHELGSFRKAQRDRPGLEGRMRTFQKQAAGRLVEIDTEISAESAESLKLPPSTVAEIQNLGKAFERLTATLETTRKQRRKLENRFNRMTDQRKSMRAPADVLHLETAVQSAQEAGPIEKRLAEMRSFVAALENELNRCLKRQTLWGGPLADIDVLPCPSKASIDRFEEQFDASQRRIEKQREGKAAAESEIVQIQTDLQAIDRLHQVPTEWDLNDARSLRDRGWGLIRQGLAGEEVPPAESDAFVGSIEGAAGLPEAFEASMTRADRIADRLRREAEQVSQKGLLEARRKHYENLLVSLEGELDNALDRHSKLTAEWQALWKPCGITPLSLKEMRAWLSDIESLREKLFDLKERKTQSETTATERAALKSSLLLALEAAGAPQEEGAVLAKLIKTARAHIKTQQDLESRITAADKDLFNLGGELEEAAAGVADLENALSNWKTNWERNVGKIGLNADASPTAALAVIESIREARNQINEAEVLKKRIDGIDRDSAAFKTRVDELVDTFAPDLKAGPQDRAAELLYAGLTTAREADSKQQGLKTQIAAAKKEAEDAEKRISQCTASIESLCQEARCEGADALAETEKRAQTRKNLVRERDGLESRLRGLSAGATVEEFIAEAASVEADSIGPELEELKKEIKRLEQERSELDQAIGTEKAELKRMDGSAEAAGHAEEAERLLANLESHVEKYARFKIAAFILSRTVEQYREKHQGPLISRASELFSQITLGAFSRLRAEYDERGNPVLVGIRPESGAQVTVEGMSDGTADQLYLALRLASLEQYLEHNEPLPFVVDDILLRFDDDRSMATLKVLCELSRKTQVIFFTHHHHLVELVENRLSDSAIVQYTLGSEKST
ncbi:MAG: AAA family ATPase [Desulfosarcina sp.]|nr:AAA family ATPase [Desulfosarcina sp.]MBC2744378.1 AAA family ATPase [Desulfosarcina sp.]MBC2767286.1 AAA family ATPase [Desulfosarcina sp.]